MSYQGQGGERASVLLLLSTTSRESCKQNVDFAISCPEHWGLSASELVLPDLANCAWPSLDSFSPLFAECCSGFHINEHIIGPLKNKHRIIELCGLEGTLKITQDPAMGLVPPTSSCCLMPIHGFAHLQGGAHTAPLGSSAGPHYSQHFQHLPSTFLRKYF